MSETHASRQTSTNYVAAALLLIVALYSLTAVFQLPQAGTAKILGSHLSAVEHEDAASAPIARLEPAPPPYFMITPFVLLLGAIAVLPLVPQTEHWWESNLHRFYVAGGLGLATLAYYVFLHAAPVDRHFLDHRVVAPAESGLSVELGWTIVENAVFNEYIPFIVLLFSLFTISGGIRITGDLAAHPGTNTAFIGAGGLLASLVGTTGAAMLLIRPLLETNRERKHVRHTVIFFIFVVCNCGGCLLPIGDPPLFLGYLQGVDFFWTLSLWPAWLLTNGLLLAVYYAWDRYWYYPHEATQDIARDEIALRPLTISGLSVNGPLLVGVVAAVALLDPTKAVPLTDWHPWLYLREIVQLTLVALSLALGSSEPRRANQFNYQAIIEVAALFFGIFLCMQPALQILAVRGASLGVNTPREFFWATGSLSSVLDNAPTYLVFFKTAQSLHVADAVTIAGVEVRMLTGISLGAVFLGAMTYIGNGPNFMVKAIAEKSGVRMPSFFGYLVYSLGILLPVFMLTSWVCL